MTSDDLTTDLGQRILRYFWQLFHLSSFRKTSHLFLLLSISQMQWSFHLYPWIQQQFGEVRKGTVQKHQDRRYGMAQFAQQSYAK